MLKVQGHILLLIWMKQLQDDAPTGLALHQLAQVALQQCTDLCDHQTHAHRPVVRCHLVQKNYISLAIFVHDWCRVLRHKGPARLTNSAYRYRNARSSSQIHPVRDAVQLTLIKISVRPSTCLSS